MIAGILLMRGFPFGFILRRGISQTADTRGWLYYRKVPLLCDCIATLMKLFGLSDNRQRFGAIATLVIYRFHDLAYSTYLWWYRWYCWRRFLLPRAFEGREIIIAVSRDYHRDTSGSDVPFERLAAGWRWCRREASLFLSQLLSYFFICIWFSGRATILANFNARLHSPPAYLIIAWPQINTVICVDTLLFWFLHFRLDTGDFWYFIFSLAPFHTAEPGFRFYI